MFDVFKYQRYAASNFLPFISVKFFFVVSDVLSTVPYTLQLANEIYKVFMLFTQRTFMGFTSLKSCGNFF